MEVRVCSETCVTLCQIANSHIVGGSNLHRRSCSCTAACEATPKDSLRTLQNSLAVRQKLKDRLSAYIISIKSKPLSQLRTSMPAIVVCLNNLSLLQRREVNILQSILQSRTLPTHSNAVFREGVRPLYNEPHRTYTKDCTEDTDRKD